VLLVLSLPIILTAFGVSALLLPFAAVAGAGFTMWYWAGIAVLVLQLGLEIAALPGLFARKMMGWTLLFYSQIVSFVYSMVSGSYISAIIGALIGLYILFQIREKYSK